MLFFHKRISGSVNALPHFDPRWLFLLIGLVTSASGPVIGQQPAPTPPRSPLEKKPQATPDSPGVVPSSRPASSRTASSDGAEERRPTRNDFFGPDDRPPPTGPRRPLGPEGRNPDEPPGPPGLPGGGFGRTLRGGPSFGPPDRGGQFDQHRLEDMERYDPDMYELEKKDRDLEKETLEMSQQLRRAPRDQRDELKKKLQELVQKHFDARQARRELQLKRLEAELERMRESMKKRLDLREQIIDRRVAELTGEQNELDF